MVSFSSHPEQDQWTEDRRQLTSADAMSSLGQLLSLEIASTDLLKHNLPLSLGLQPVHLLLLPPRELSHYRLAKMVISRLTLLLLKLLQRL
jgi:hypothetical protein